MSFNFPGHWIPHLKNEGVRSDYLENPSVSKILWLFSEKEIYRLKFDS